MQFLLCERGIFLLVQIKITMLMQKAVTNLLVCEKNNQIAKRIKLSSI